MKVRVRLFALARERAGAEWVELSLETGATIGDLREQLAREHSGLAAIVPHVAFAVGTRYAGDQTVIAEGSEIACIPPVSGG